MPERPWTDEFTLLCERCGYVIEGLDPHGACPECGKAIAESLPERRVGTHWQNNPHLGSLVRAAIPVLFRSSKTLRILAPNEVQDAKLRRYLLSIASIGLSLPILVVASVMFSFLGAYKIAGILLLLVIFAPLFSFQAFSILTGIESRGLVYFGNRRGARITQTIARSVTAHGSIGWVISGLGGGAFLSAAVMAFGPFTNQATGVVFFWIGMVFMLGGFMFFEVFAWLGLRRCKFANRVRPTEPEAPERP